MAFAIGVSAQDNPQLKPQSLQPDTLLMKKQLGEVEIISPRTSTSLKLTPFATSLVSKSVLGTMPRSVGAEEALRLVPGVRIENQANGSRLHLSIRGQGILSERGLRGIKVLIDGIPVNDPSGFAADLYDIDWLLADRIEVLRGATGTLYGGSSSAGVLNIITKSGGDKPVNGELSTSFGSNAFYKINGMVGGTNGNVNYRLSYSRTQGKGYRDHTRFWANNLNEKIQWTPSDKVKITQVLMLTDYFNQNPEGLSIDQLNDNPLQPNPDAIPFNEYQKTNRITNGIAGEIKTCKNQEIQFNAFVRITKYKETSNKSAQYRNMTAPGGSLQYNIHLGKNKIKNMISAGGDIQWQSIKEYKLKSMKDTTRVDDWSEDNMEDSLLLANQLITQRGAGVFLTDQLNIGKKLSITASIRYDNIHNELKDNKNITYNLSGKKDFGMLTGRAGIAYSIIPAVNIYGNWGMGFLPPATEELASNPASFGGFNDKLVPATSQSEELGIRGSVAGMLYYDVNGFFMTTKDDFFRYKLYPARGNQEVFYGNTGDTRRYGIEAFVSFNPIKQLSLQAAYTFTHFTYVSPDSLNGNFLPNCPQHQLFTDLEYRITKNFSAGVSVEYCSKWAIYTDKIHNDLFQDGYYMLHARVIYKWALWKLNGELSFYAKNILGAKYVAFTEPDPDGNCYQPGAGREFFGGVKIRF